MISPEQERQILDTAYVPEHGVGLMALVSKGEPFVIDGYLYFAGESWVIVVGYPLDRNFVGEEFAAAVHGAVRRFQAKHLWFIAPEMPGSLVPLCRERESDSYYTLALEGFEVGRNLQRLVARAARELTVERGGELSPAHRELVAEFLEREKPGARVRQLYLSMAEYVPRSDSARVLTARDKGGNVSALYVVDLAAKSFATYVVGCRSRRHSVPGASDLLFLEMVNLARERGKRYIHLGLGVNEGIRAFKAKWGGVPWLRYEFGALVRGHSPIPASLASKL